MGLLHAIAGLFSRPVVFFTASRYLSYALLFLRGLIIAKLLGPYYFGIWGFITLYQQYLSFTSMGIQYAVNTELSLLDADSEKRKRDLINSSFTLTLIIFLILTGLALIMRFFNVDIFRTEGSYKYIILTFLIGALQHFRELFANIFRVFNSYWRIAAGELLLATVTLLVALFFQNEDLLLSLMISWVISLVLSILLFIIKAPFQLRLSLEGVIVKVLFSVGLPLLLYNVSYYLMTLSSRTIVSIFYDLEIVGYYTFAHTITNATLLGLNAASWVFYPVILARLKIGTEEPRLRETIKRVNSLYGVAVVLIVYLCIIFAPLLYMFFENYRPASAALNILLLSQAILSLGFVFNTLAIARKKHRQLAVVSLSSSIFSAALCLLFAFLKMDFVWLTVATLISYTAYTTVIILYGIRTVKLQGMTVLQFLPWSLQISLIMFVIGTFSKHSVIYFLLGLSIFLWANKANLVEIFRFVLKLETPRSAADA